MDTSCISGMINFKICINRKCHEINITKENYNYSHLPKAFSSFSFPSNAASRCVATRPGSSKQTDYFLFLSQNEFIKSSFSTSSSPCTNILKILFEHFWKMSAAGLFREHIGTYSIIIISNHKRELLCTLKCVNFIMCNPYVPVLRSVQSIIQRVSQLS